MIELVVDIIEFLILLMTSIAGAVFLSAFVMEDLRTEGCEQYECKYNPLCLFAFIIEAYYKSVPLYCLNETGKKNIKLAIRWQFVGIVCFSIIYFIIVNPYDRRVFIDFITPILFLAEGFRRYIITLKMIDTGFDNETIDKFTMIHCKKGVIWILIGVSMQISYFFAVNTVINKKELSSLPQNYKLYQMVSLQKKIKIDEYICSFINKEKEMKLRKILQDKKIGDNLFKKRINSIHDINGKYVYAPLMSMVLDYKRENELNKNKEIDIEDLIYKKFLIRRYGWKIFIFSIIIKLFVFFIFSYYFIHRVNIGFTKREIKKLAGKIEKEKLLGFLRWIKRREVIFLIFMIVSSFSLSMNTMEKIGIQDLMAIHHYSKITNKKLSSLLDKIKKLNIKTDEQLSEAIREGKIKISDVLDSTLTVQIEDSRLDKNIKKELLDYYRQNYEKYRYRIVNGYLIDFIHGKYKKINYGG